MDIKQLARELIELGENAEANMEGADGDEFHFWEQVLTASHFLATMLIREAKGEPAMPEGYKAPPYVPVDIDI